MSAKFTPGPWRELVTRIDDASGYQICHLDLHGKTEAERDANRRLIAAAPDLVAACNAALHALRSYQYGNSATDLAAAVANKCEATLAKAGAL